MSTFAKVAALKKVDLPTFGLPTSPIFTVTHLCAWLLFFRIKNLIPNLDKHDVQFWEVQTTVSVQVYR